MWEAVVRYLGRVLSLAIVASFYTLSANAGGSLVDPAPVPLAWTGYYIGGGLGVHQLKADVDVNSKTKSRSAGHFLCKDKDGNQIAFQLNDGSGPESFLNQGADATAKQEFAKTCIQNDTKPDISIGALNNYQSEFNVSNSESYSGDWGLFGTGTIGYDYQISSKAVFGVFASFDFGSTDLDFKNTFTGTPTGTYTGTNDIPSLAVTTSGDLEADKVFTIGARFGYLFNEQQTLGYVLAGYTRATFNGQLGLNISGDDTPAPSYEYVPINLTENIDERLNGISVGFGAEHRLDSNWSIRFEYRYTWFNNIKRKLSDFKFSDNSALFCDKNDSCANVFARSTETETELEVDPSLQSVRAVLSYRY